MTFNFMIFNVWSAIVGTLIGLFSLHSAGQTIAGTGKQILVFTRPIYCSHNFGLYIQNGDESIVCFHDLKCIRHAVCLFQLSVCSNGVARGRGRGDCPPGRNSSPLFPPSCPQMKLHFLQRSMESRYFES